MPSCMLCMCDCIVAYASLTKFVCDFCRELVIFTFDTNLCLYCAFSCTYMSHCLVVMTNKRDYLAYTFNAL